MHFRSSGRNRSVLSVLFLLTLVLVTTWALKSTLLVPQGLAANTRGGPVAPSGSGLKVSPPPQSRTAQQTSHVILGQDVNHDLSRPLRDIAPIPPSQGSKETERDNLAYPNLNNAANAKDPVVQKWQSPLSMPSPLVNFDGLGNVNGVLPPDTNGDVGPNHYVQWVNLSFQIFNKSGSSLYGPAAGNTLWNGFGGACQSQNAGDPVVLYDPIADRWLMSQFTSSSPYGECIAISQTPDPTGAYYRYFFQFSTSIFYDYPHFGVWPDGYYMSANQFGGGAGRAAIGFRPQQNATGSNGYVPGVRYQSINVQPDHAC